MKPSNSRKYNDEGFASSEGFSAMGAHPKYCDLLSGATNLALSKQSKAQYKTAVNHIDRVENLLNTDMSLPFTVPKTLNYVGYLLDSRGCSAKTVGQYLSAIRMLHLCKGHDPSCLRPNIVSLILKGREHFEEAQKTLQQKPVRIPVTFQVMKYLKRVLRESDYGTELKLRLWAIFCLMWSASLRVSEVLSRDRDSFDPLTTLCSEDVEILSEHLMGQEKKLIRLHLKSPKERRIGNGVKLEIFENGSICCPVRAWMKWSSKVELKQNQPVFMESRNECFTAAAFNRIVSSLTANLTDGTDGILRSHSFRAGNK